MELKRGNLGYLGIEFQYRLAHHFMDDKKFFGDVYDIIDNNMFTDPNLKRFVGSLMEYYKEYDYVPSYQQIEIRLRSQSKSDQDVEYILSSIEKIQETTCEGSDEIKMLAQKFFRQQNFVKFNNKITELLKSGDIDRFDELEELWQKALCAGNREEIGIKLRDNLGDVLSEDYRSVIPTGIDGIDEALEGGIGKGELGVIIGPSSFGKSLSINELVCTPNGFVRNGDLEVGDYVIGQNGLPTKVIGVFPQGKRDMYTVTFSDGVKCDCDLEHLWNVNSAYQRCGKKYIKGKSKNRDDKYYEPDNSFKTLSLREILNKGLYRNWGGKHIHNFKVPMPEPVHFSEIKIPELLPPYLIGAFIGDGCFSRLSITSIDQEIIDNICNLTDVVSIIDDDRNNELKKIQLSYKLRNDLNKYFSLNEKSGDKFIPRDYLYNSIENRIKLLNGLMDTDGTCQKNGCSCYNTKSIQLAKDVRTLVLSLGGFASLREKKASYFNEKYNKLIDCGIQYEVTISLCDSNIPIFNLSRKQNRVIYRTKNSGLRFIESVEYKENIEAQCIKVDAEDELYLTRDFIVTHNTSLTTSIANYAASQGYKVAQIVFEDKEKQIQRKHIGKITGIESRVLSKPENIEHVKEVMSTCDIFDNNLRIKKFNTGEISPTQIRNYVKRLINTGFKPDMVIVDYFECLVPSKNFKDQWAGEGHTMRQLESIASDLDIGLWVPTQGTKDSLNSEIVTMDKAGGSFKKIQIAHIVISIARAIEDIENNIATIAILKNRSGKSGRVMEGIYFNNGTCIINTDKAKTLDGMVEYNADKEQKQKDLTKDLLKKRVAERTGTTKNNLVQDEIF